jgi:hypothetical protein
MATQRAHGTAPHAAPRAEDERPFRELLARAVGASGAAQARGAAQFCDTLARAVPVAAGVLAQHALASRLANKSLRHA